MTGLPNYYYTFVDVMEFRDLTLEVVTSLATTQFHFDIVSGANGERESALCMAL